MRPLHQGVFWGEENQVPRRLDCMLASESGVRGQAIEVSGGSQCLVDPEQARGQRDPGGGPCHLLGFVLNALIFLTISLEASTYHYLNHTQ